MVTVNGEGITLSRVDRIIIDTYVDTLSLKECLNKLKEVNLSWGNFKVSTIRRRIKRPDIAKVIMDRFRDRAIVNGLTADKWKAIGILAMTGNADAVVDMITAITYSKGTPPMPPEGGWKLTKLTAFFWAKLGEAFGYVDAAANRFSADNMQINFTQKSGRD